MDYKTFFSATENCPLATHHHEPPNLESIQKSLPLHITHKLHILNFDGCGNKLWQDYNIYKY